MSLSCFLGFSELKTLVSQEHVPPFDADCLLQFPGLSPSYCSICLHNHYVHWDIDAAGHIDRKAVPKLDLHFQDQMKYNAHFPEVKLFLEGAKGNGIPSSILVIPQPWFQIVLIPWPMERLAVKFCSLKALT